MAKVLVLTSSFLPRQGGLQYELKWFLDNLDRRLATLKDVEATFVYPHGVSTPYSVFENIATYDLQLGEDRRRHAIARMIVKLGKLLGATTPDIVHCHTMTPVGRWAALASLLIRRPPKIVVTSHGNDIVNLPHWSYGRKETFRSKLVDMYTAHRMAAQILPSRAMTEWAIRSGTREDRLVFIPNGIPLGDEYDFQESLEDEVPLLLSDNPSSHDGINFLSLSGARTIKNLAALVEAFAQARDRLDRSKLILSCHGTGAELIRGLVGEKGLTEDVIFIGEVIGPNKLRYFAASDVYCNVSHFENFPITLLEAMKHKMAILASNVGGIPELVEHERNGLLVSPTDVTGIAESMVRLYRDADLRSRLVAQAQEDVKQYSMTRVIDEHLALYERVASGGD